MSPPTSRQVAYHRDPAAARSAASASSYTTHPGPLAAECCAFLAHALVRAIHRPSGGGPGGPSGPGGSGGRGEAAAFLDGVADEYGALLAERLAAMEDPASSTANAVGFWPLPPYPPTRHEIEIK